MDTERPEHLPAAVWQFYRELREPNADGSPSVIERPKYRVPVLRLLGIHPEAPEGIAKTWRNLQRQMTRAKRPGWEPSDWRLFFDLLWSLPGSFDPRAYEARRRTQELAPRIARLARELSQALTEYNHLAERHSIDIPDEGLSGFGLIESAGKNQDPDTAARFEHFSLPYFGFSDHKRVCVQYLPPPARMIEEIAFAFEGFQPWANAHFGEYANAPEVSQQTAIIDHFQDRWSWYQGNSGPSMLPPYVMAARFEIGATDLARILTALFGFEFSRESVNYARGQRAKNRKD